MDREKGQLLHNRNRQHICHLESAILDFKIFPKRKKTAKNY